MLGEAWACIILTNPVCNPDVQPRLRTMDQTEVSIVSKKEGGIGGYESSIGFSLQKICNLVG